MKKFVFKNLVLVLSTLFSLLLSACYTCKNHMSINDILDKEWVPVYIENERTLSKIPSIEYNSQCEHIRLKFFALKDENCEDKLALGGEMQEGRMFGGVITFKNGREFDLSKVVMWKGGVYNQNLKPYDDLFFKALKDSTMGVWDEDSDTLYFYATRDKWQILTLKLKNTQTMKPCPYCENRKRETQQLCENHTQFIEQSKLGLLKQEEGQN